jgi:GTP-binding protein HflX
MEAFAATLEELHDADLLLHVVDASSPRMEEQMGAVKGILERLHLEDIPHLLVLNKSDRLDPQVATASAKKLKGIAISALDTQTLPPLLEKMEGVIWPRFSSPSISTGCPPR